MSTLVRFGLTFLVILLLIGMLALFNGRAGMQIIATGLSVVLILAVWLVSRMGNVQDLRSQNAPENVDRNAKKLIRIINKNFNSAGVEEIGSKTQQTIVETLKAVQSGQFKTEKQALNSFKCVPPAKFNEAKDTGSLAMTLAAFYIMADEMNEHGFNTRTRVDNFIAGIYDDSF